MYLFVVITTDLMLLPLQGVFCMSLLPRVSLRFAQGYELVALSGRFFPLLTLYYYILSCLRIRNACSCDLLIKDYSELSDSSFLISSISGSDLRILSSISAVVL